MIALFRKYRIARSKPILIPKIVLETIVILFLILVAGLLGNYIAVIATRQIDNDRTRFVVGIFVGLLVGITVGVFVHKIWQKLLPLFSNSDLGNNDINANL